MNSEHHELLAGKLEHARKSAYAFPFHSHGEMPVLKVNLF